MQQPAAVYNVTKDRARFREALQEVFPRRELLTMMSVVCAYSDSIREAAYGGGEAKIDFRVLCEEASVEDGISPSEIKTLLEKLSIGA